MSSSGPQRYYWCISHRQVESEANMCPAKDRLGPYNSAAEAERALDRVQERNTAWEAEDDRWDGNR